MAPRLCDALGIPQLSMGDMLRGAVATGGMAGSQAQAMMQRGGLLPDSLVAGMLRERISREDCERGFVLDGFPRTREQARLLDELLGETGDEVTGVISLVVPDEALLERVRGRWVHEASGRSYHATRAPPRSLRPGTEPKPETMLDDETGEPLVQRADDTERVLKSRLQAYHEETAPILWHYALAGVVIEADADCMPQEMWGRVRAVMGL